MGFIENVNELLPLLQQSQKFLNEDTLKAWVEESLPKSLQDSMLIQKILEAMLNSSSYATLLENLNTLFSNYESIQKTFNQNYIEYLCNAYVTRFFENENFQETIAQIIYTQVETNLESKINSKIEQGFNNIELKPLISQEIANNSEYYAREALVPVVNLKDQALLTACLLFTARKLFLIGYHQDTSHLNKQVLEG